MTGLNDTDIRLNSEWQLTQATDGDAPLCSGLECLYQNIVLEALTQPGDVFYDAEFGWGLYDFIQSEDTELTRLEITQRVRLKLQKREVILPESIEMVNNVFLINFNTVTSVAITSGIYDSVARKIYV